MNVNEGDIVVDSLNIGMTAGRQNPMDRVHFYDHADSSDKRHLRPDQVSDMLPAAFEVGLAMSGTCLVALDSRNCACTAAV